MQVNVLVEYGEEHVKGIDLDGLAKFVMKKMELPECADVTITFVTNERIHELNRNYRGIDRPTDVLSFECDNIPFEGEDLGEVEEFELGDTIIATDVALAQTEEYGTTFEEEVTLLTVHSLLHLCGYDHIEDEDYKVMHALEEELIAEWEAMHK
jgi:probable rRNA maturation factor